MGIRRKIYESVISRMPRSGRIAVERIYYYPAHRSMVKLFKQFSSKEKNSLDIGANKGDVTLFLSHYSRRVFCFEPLPWIAETLKWRFDGMNVKIQNVALGDHAGTAEIRIPVVNGTQYDSRASLVADLKHQRIYGEKVNEKKAHTVKIERLDDMNIENIGFMKIDVEGYEEAVLEGARYAISTMRPNMLIEIEQRYHKKDLDQVFKYIRDFGYTGYFVYRGKLVDLELFDVCLMQNEDNEKKTSYINNFIFTIPFRPTQHYS